MDALLYAYSPQSSIGHNLSIHQCEPSFQALHSPVLQGSNLFPMHQRPGFPLCSRKLFLLARLKEELKRWGQDIPEEPLFPEEEKKLQRLARQKIRELKPKTLNSLLTTPSRLAVISGLVLTSCLSLYLAIGRKFSRQETWREASRLEFHLLHPRGTLQEAPELFSWREVPGREEFLFQLQDEELGLIYKTRTWLPWVHLPEAARLSLIRGKTYIWTVEARDRNSRLLAAEYLTFRIED